VKNVGCFLNLNELEFSDTNAEALKSRGYVLKNNESNTVLGSAEIAKTAFEIGCGENNCGKVNFCSSRYKDAVQLRLRLIRTAQKNARPFDEITEDGTVIYGRIDIDETLLNSFVSFLKEMELPDEAYVVNAEKHTIETAAGIAEELAAILNEDEMSEFGEIKFWVIERYPFENGFLVGCDRIF
jgi:Uncharacterized conserved protein related to pyruvate formate-lyase activating enzyme